MAREGKPHDGAETTPTNFPNVEPPAYQQAVGSAWLMECVMQMQQTIGELKANTANLTAASRSQGDKLDRISHRIYGASAILTVLLAVGGFFLSKIWDGLVLLLKASH